MTDQTNTELRILDLEQKLSIAQHNYIVLSTNFDELRTKNQELQAQLSAAEAKCAALQASRDAGISSLFKIDEEVMSRLVSDKLCEYIEALGSKYPLPDAVDRALERTTEQLISDVIEQADFADAAEMALTKAVEEQLEYIRIDFRR